MNKIAIIGCGNVGMSYAYALVNSKTNVDELVFICIYYWTRFPLLF